MRRDPPPEAATVREWVQFLHECMEVNADHARARSRVNLVGIVTILAFVVSLTVGVARFGVVGIQWADNVDHHFDTLQITLDQHSRRLDKIGSRVQELQCISLIDQQVTQEQARTICGVQP